MASPNPPTILHVVQYNPDDKDLVYMLRYHMRKELQTFPKMAYKPGDIVAINDSAPIEAPWKHLGVIVHADAAGARYWVGYFRKNTINGELVYNADYLTDFNIKCVVPQFIELGF